MGETWVKNKETNTKATSYTKRPKQESHNVIFTKTQWLFALESSFTTAMLPSCMQVVYKSRNL